MRAPRHADARPHAESCILSLSARVNPRLVCSRRRIAPSPYLFFELVNGNFILYSSLEYAVMFVTTPLPFVLNSYWFYLLVVGLNRVYERQKQVAAQQKADAAAAELHKAESERQKAESRKHR